MATPKQISAPLTIGAQGSGVINIGTALNRIVLPGLTISKPLLLDSFGQVTSGDISIGDITAGPPNSILATIGGIPTWTTTLAITSITLTTPPEFSVSGSPATAPNANLNITKVSQLQNLFYSSPSSISGQPAFRSIQNVDLPIVDILHGGTGINTIGAAGTVAYSNGSTLAYTSTAGTLGQVLTSTGGGSPTWQTLSGLGTVTSITANDNSTGLLLLASPNPITTTGTINLTGILNVSSGGTGLDGTTFTAGSTFYSTGPNNISVLPPGLNGDILTLVGGLPAWTTPGVAGTIADIVVNTPGGLLVPNVVNPTGPNTIINIDLSSQLQNRVFSSPDGAAGTPSFRALLNNDLPIINVSHGGTGLSAVGPSGSVLFSNGSALGFTTAPTLPGQVLTSTGGIPTWTTIGGGTVFSVGFSTGSTGLIVNSNTTNPITTTGTFTLSGIVNPSSGGTGYAGPFSNGDLLYYTGSAFNRLPVGGINQVLTVAGGIPSWQNPAGTGTLTSVALNLSVPLDQVLNVAGSPVTGSTGTFTLDLDTQIANVFFSGPMVGPAAQPTFRTIVNADLPLVDIGHGGTNSTAVPTAGGVAYGDGTAYQFTAAGTIGQVLTSNGAAAPTWTTLAGLGTVTSVDGSGGVTGLTLTGGPIINAGTLTLGGTLLPTSGGTGLTSYAIGDLIYANAPNVLTKLPLGPNGNVLTVSGANIIWAPLPGVGTVTSVGLTAPAIFTVGGSPVTGSGTLSLTLNNEPANTVFAGPALGAPAVPTFRSLVNADLPIIDIAHGGTNSSTALLGDQIMISSPGGVSIVELGSTGALNEVLTSQGPGLPPVWSAIAAGGTVTSISGAAGSSGLTIATTPSPIVGAGTVQIGGGTLLATFGGTGLNTYAIGDIIYSNSSTTLNRLAIGAPNDILTVSGGIPAWTSISGAGIVTSVTASAPLSATVGGTPNISLTGIVPIALGGTNSGAALNNNRVMVSSAGSIVEFSAGTTGQVLTSNGALAPTWSSLAALGVTSFSAGTTGFTPNTPTTGAIFLGGILNIAHGGTNTGTLGGAGTVVYSNGTSYDFTSVGTGFQVLISNGSSAPSWSTLTAGAGISISNGVGTTTISGTGVSGPVLTQDTFTVKVGASASLNVLSNDTFPIPFASMLVTTTLDPVAEGSFASLTANPIAFTPAVRALGPMIFGYQATDTNGNVASTMCKIIVDTSLGVQTRALEGSGTTFIIRDMATGSTTSPGFNPGLPIGTLATDRNDALIYFNGGGNRTIRAYDIPSNSTFTLMADYNTSTLLPIAPTYFKLAFDNQRSTLYMLSFSSPNLYICAVRLNPYDRSNPGVQAFTSTINTLSAGTFNALFHASVEPVSGFLYLSVQVGGANRYIYVYDFNNNTVLSQNLITSSAVNIQGLFTANGNFYISNSTSNNITRYNPNTWVASTVASPTSANEFSEVPFGY